MSKLFVFDTNNLVSAILIPVSTPRRALNKAFETGHLAVSYKTMDEFIEVLFRKKFDRYFFTDEERWVAIKKVESNVLYFHPSETITACRDPKDNKFLELAVAANAVCIVTGDNDLLTLHPFRNIPILNAAGFLQQF